MADIGQAVQFVLRQEDARLSGEVTKLPGDRGGLTRFGLASRWHPELVERGFYNCEKVPHDEAITIAEATYETDYAAKLDIVGIADQDVANRILSFAVNEGIHQAATILQRALNSLGASLEEDGIVGPATLAAINAAKPIQLLAVLRSFEITFYRRLVAVRPELLPYLNGFLDRANA